MQINDLRHEIKFLQKNNDINYLFHWIKNYTTFRKDYPDRIVNTIYLDNIYNQSATDNLIGISNRKKYRIRWYGFDLTSINFEIKIKKNKQNFKKTFKLNKSILSNINDNFFVYQQLNKLLIKHGVFLPDFIYPTLKVKYKRKYFKNHNGIRMTLDDDLSYSHPKFDKFFNIKNYKIIEFKFKSNEKNYLNQLFKKFYLYPTRHSKYLVGLSSFGYFNYL